MLEVNLEYLGQQILIARKNCDLTQKELAVQTRLSVKTIQDIEKGIKNPTYDTLVRLVTRLGIPANSLFQTGNTENEGELNYFLGKFCTCNSKNRKTILALLNFSIELLLKDQLDSESCR